MERARKGVACPRDRDLLFLHSLEKGGLSARARAIDFVSHEQLTKHGPWDEAESPLTTLGFLKDFRACDVGRHQIGRELDPLFIQAHDCAEDFYQ